ncbi:MAG: family 20 glycosylhydrolase [Lentisphaeria bacterium]|nr:family 20 glycosylhydrolase [Lentisphaeria bacterium]
MLKLIPCPQKMITGKQNFPFCRLENIILPEKTPQSLLTAVITLADDFETAAGKRLRFAKSDIGGKGFRFQFVSGNSESEDYLISADENGFTVTSSGEKGLFYAVQTIRQIIKSGEGVYPELTIEDTPDFPARGLYHDITRGAVPTFDFLCALAEKMAYYKLNQLQLYIEHTFAFARHCEIWAGSDPITAEEIIRLDNFCKERHIELVPSLSTFGHCYMLLRSKRLRDLNELDEDASLLPFSFYERMRHYTLNCTDERSILLLEEMLGEFIPLFSSKYFNICCDETFDLGKGKNAELAKKIGTTALYTDFLQKIIAIVRKHERHAMFWGDIIAQQPELISTLPEGTVALEWDYSKDSHIWDTAKLSQLTENFYICPGTSVWFGWGAKIDTARSNILSYARKGKKFGAKGLLNTNWGDFGNVNLFTQSIYGMLCGAAAAWNIDGAEDFEYFNSALDKLEFDACGVSELWYKFAETMTLHWLGIELLTDTGENVKNDMFLQKLHNTDPEKLQADITALEELFEQISIKLASAHPADKQTVPELLAGLKMSILMHKTALAILTGDKIYARCVADELRSMEPRISALWHKRNKPSEYYRIKDAVLKLADKLDSLDEL